MPVPLNVWRQGKPAFSGHAGFSFNLFHLVDDPRAALGAMAQMVKPGGLFISKTPCLSDGAWFIRVIVWVMRAVGKAPPVQFFSVAEWEGWLREAGFDIEHAESRPASPPSRYVVARRV